MKIVEVREKTVSIASEIKNAFIDFSTMTVSVLALYTDVIREGRPVVGYGFNSNGRYSQGCFLRERFIPRIMNAAPEELLDSERDNLDPFAIWQVMMKNEKPGGHGERSVAVGVVDMAVWDAVSKIEEKPLYRLLAERFNQGRTAEKLAVYAAGGYYYPAKGEKALVSEMKNYLDIGYSTVKMKIGGTSLEEDLRRIEAVLNLVGSGSSLAVDANGRFDLKTAITYGKALEPYGLCWYEEPGDPLDYALQAELAEHYAPPMATGENLFSHQDVRNLLRYGGMRADRDILQMDPVLSYGLVEYLRIIEVCKELGWPINQIIPHGGHQFALNIAAGLGLGGNESYPKVFEPFGGFADHTPVIDGRVKMPEVPGVGFEAKKDLIDLFKANFD
jgi:L-alanine-DL-glutamate epimerase-like enolase superfamily enzyme